MSDSSSLATRLSFCGHRCVTSIALPHFNIPEKEVFFFFFFYYDRKGWMFLLVEILKYNQ